MSQSGLIWPYKATEKERAQLAGVYLDGETLNNDENKKALLSRLSDFSHNQLVC